MLYKTRGIVLSFFKYRETSIIVKIFTEDFGLQSYIENGVRSSKGKGKIALFQPLTLLDLVVYHKKEKHLSRISELNLNTPFYSIPTDIKKTTIVIFLTEILSYTLKEQEENRPLFQFIYEALIFLEKNDYQIENFHLFFMMGLSAFLGFGPEKIVDMNNQFSEHGIPLARDEKVILEKLLHAPFGETLNINKNLRIRLLDLLIDFYRLNLENIKNVKSVQILKEVLE